MNSRIQKIGWFKSHWVILVTLLLFILLSSAFVKEIVRSHQIESEILALETEINDLESKNNKEANFVEYLKTEHYLEEQARLKLGLKKEGEKVVVLHDGSSDANVSFVNENKNKDYSNPRKWFAYFFEK